MPIVVSTIPRERVARKGDTPTSGVRCGGEHSRRELIQPAQSHVFFAQPRGVRLCFALPSPGADYCNSAGAIGVMADLLRRVAERADTTAFRELYQTYGPRVKAYMMRLGADAGTAEDLAHETLFTVWRRAALYRAEKGSVASWIFAIARNLRIDRLRREVAWQPLPQEHFEEAAGEALPDAALSEKERQARVHAALSHLPSEQHEVVVLSYLEGLSHGEIAQRLGLPLGTVKSRIRIAYQKIRTALEDLR